MSGKVFKSQAVLATRPFIACGITGEKAIDKTVLPKIGN
jgi:hypothetical protein